MATKFCLLCYEGVNEALGSILPKYSCHLMCLRFSFGFSDKNDFPKEKEFLNEMMRTIGLICKYCRRTRASVRCAFKYCETNYHLSCGIENNALNLHNKFISYCNDHRFILNVPNNKFDGEKLCGICEIKPKDEEEALVSVCCGMLNMRLCTQVRASFGQHGCATCGDEDKFLEIMFNHGIYFRKYGNEKIFLKAGKASPSAIIQRMCKAIEAENERDKNKRKRNENEPIQPSQKKKNRFSLPKNGFPLPKNGFPLPKKTTQPSKKKNKFSLPKNGFPFPGSQSFLNVSDSLDFQDVPKSSISQLDGGISLSSSSPNSSIVSLSPSCSESKPSTPTPSNDSSLSLSDISNIDEPYDHMAHVAQTDDSSSFSSQTLAQSDSYSSLSEEHMAQTDSSDGFLSGVDDIYSDGDEQNIEQVPQNSMDSLAQNEMQPLAQNEIQPLVLNELQPFVVFCAMNPLAQNIIDVDDICSDGEEEHIEQVPQNAMDSLAQNEMQPLAQNKIQPLAQNVIQPLAHNEMQPLPHDITVKPLPKKMFQPVLQNGMQQVPENTSIMKPVCQDSPRPLLQNTMLDTTNPNLLDTTNHSLLEAIPSVFKNTRHLQSQDTIQPNLLDTTQPNMLDTTQPNKLDTTQPNMLDTTQPNMLDTAQPNLLDTTQPNMLDTVQPIAQNAIQPMQQNTISEPQLNDAIQAILQYSNLEEMPPETSANLSDDPSRQFCATIPEQIKTPESSPEPKVDAKKTKSKKALKKMGSKTRKTIPLKDRNLYHALNSLPVKDGEGYADCNYSWAEEYHTKNINDFVDLNSAEKLLTNYWNRHKGSIPSFAIKHIGKILEDFVEKSGKLLIQQNLYRNFILMIASFEHQEIITDLQVLKLTIMMQKIMKQEKDEGKELSHEKICKLQYDSWDKNKIEGPISKDPDKIPFTDNQEHTNLIKFIKHSPAFSQTIENSPPILKSMVDNSMLLKPMVDSSSNSKRKIDSPTKLKMNPFIKSMSDFCFNTDLFLNKRNEINPEKSTSEATTEIISKYKIPRLQVNVSKVSPLNVQANILSAEPKQTAITAQPSLKFGMSTPSQLINKSRVIPLLEVGIQKPQRCTRSSTPTRPILSTPSTQPKVITPNTRTQPKLSTPSKITRQNKNLIGNEDKPLPTKHFLKVEYNNDLIVEHIVEFNPEQNYLYCEECNQLCNNRRTLGGHKKLVHETLRCPSVDCDFTTTEENCLNKHMKKHHEYQYYQDQEL